VKKNIIVYAWKDEILNKYAHPNLEYGKGKEIAYTYNKIETELAHSLIFNKVLIDMEKLVEFEFHLELFHGSSSILNDISAKIPQEKLSADKIHNIKTTIAITERAHHILATLDYVMCFAKKTGGDPNQAILEYMEKWKLDVANLKLGQLPSLQLKHLVALYEEVEDLLGKILAECVNQVYCGPLPNDVKDELVVCMTKTTLETLLITFRRFILRYLCVDQINPDNFVIDYLCSPAICWPQGAFKEEEEIRAVFPKHLCVGHTYNAYAFLRDKYEDQERKKQASFASKMVSNAAGGPSVQQQAVAKKRNQKSFATML